MAGAVGDDPFGPASLDNLRGQGVDVAAVQVVAEPTGCAFIAVDPLGENAITVASGANLAVRAAALSDAELAHVSILVLQMEVKLEESLAIASRAKRAGARVLWNLAPAPTEAERERLPALLAATDILIVNEHEAMATARLLGLSPRDAKAAAAVLARAHDVTCIVTEGAAGATAFAADGGSLYAPAPAITPVDTTGAGDTFVGVLAASLAERMELSAAMNWACRAASLACLSPGAQPGMPDRAALAAETAR